MPPAAPVPGSLATAVRLMVMGALLIMVTVFAVEVPCMLLGLPWWVYWPASWPLTYMALTRFNRWANRCLADNPDDR